MYAHSAWRAELTVDKEEDLVMARISSRSYPVQLRPLRQHVCQDLLFHRAGPCLVRLGRGHANERA